MFDEDDRNSITYFWYGPGDDDDGNPHNGMGEIHVHPEIVDILRNTFSVRESKILDIIADWVSETLNVDIDEISIYPYRNKNPNY
jgi:hypothetical protein